MYAYNTYAGEIPCQLARDTAGDIVSAGGVGCCYTENGEGDKNLDKADEPDPAKGAGRGSVPSIDGEAQHLCYGGKTREQSRKEDERPGDGNEKDDKRTRLPEGGPQL